VPGIFSAAGKSPGFGIELLPSCPVDLLAFLACSHRPEAVDQGRHTTDIPHGRAAQGQEDHVLEQNESGGDRCGSVGDRLGIAGFG